MFLQSQSVKFDHDCLDDIELKLSPQQILHVSTPRYYKLLLLSLSIPFLPESVSEKSYYYTKLLIKQFLLNRVIIIIINHEYDVDIVAQGEKAYTIASSLKHNSMSMKHQQIQHIKSKPQRHIINANNNTISSTNSLYDYIISSKKQSNTKKLSSSVNTVVSTTSYDSNLH